MRQKIKYLIFFLSFFLLSISKGYSEGSVARDSYLLRVPDSTLMESLLRDPDFNYHEIPASKGIFQKLKQWLLHSLNKTFFNNYVLLKWLFRLLAIVLIIFVAYKIIKNGFFTRKKSIHDKEFSDYDAEQIEDKETYTELLSRALNRQDYRSAVRLHFLYILHLLDQAGVIRRHESKSNYHYYLEIKDAKRKVPFKKLSDIFNFVTYGNKVIDRQGYEQLRQLFIDFQNELI